MPLAGVCLLNILFVEEALAHVADLCRRNRGHIKPGDLAEGIGQQVPASSMRQTGLTVLAYASLAYQRHKPLT